MSTDTVHAPHASRAPAGSWGKGDASRGSSGAARSGALVDGVLGLAASAFFLVQIARHAMWRDELNAWGIVLDSPTLPSLFAHLHYEGHPGLWHLLLWLAAHVSTAPQTMQVVHAAIALGIIWTIAWLSPFNRMEKLLLLLSYFVLFEYTVISRNYGVGLLLALLYADRRARHPERLASNAVLLGLLANTNVFALILAAALALEYGWSRYPGRQALGPWLRTIGGPAVLLAGMAAFSVATFWPARDISWRTTVLHVPGDRSFDEIARVLVTNFSAIVPIDVQAFWPRGALVPYIALLCLIILASIPLTIVVTIRLFAAAPRLLVIPAVTLLGSVTFNLFVYEGFIRHWGINFVAVLAAFWLLRARAPATPWAFPILGLNAAAGVLFTLQHWAIPFSNAGATADWIRSAGLRDAALIGTPDAHAAAVAELLGRPITFLDCRCTDTYLAYSDRRDDFQLTDVPGRLVEAALAHAGQAIVYLNTEPAAAGEFTALAAHGLTLRQRASFAGSLNENFYVYEIVRLGASTPAPGLAPAPG